MHPQYWGVDILEKYNGSKLKMTSKRSTAYLNLTFSIKFPSLLSEISVMKVTLPIKAVLGGHVVVVVVVLRSGHSV